MMENKQTALDWLYGMLHNEEVIVYNGLFELWYKQAKAMEKKEHERIADKAREDGWRDAKYGSQRW